jgi:uncharacterized membrane protein YfbV (UPF0208 family)
VTAAPRCQWNAPSPRNAPGRRTPVPPQYNAQDFEELQRKLMTGRFTLQQLEDAADYQLNTEILKDR